jgi:hypothetical protein
MPTTTLDFLRARPQHSIGTKIAMMLAAFVFLIGLSGCEDYTPKEFGNYIVDGKKLTPLQTLGAGTFRGGYQTYSDAPAAVVRPFRDEVRLVLYNRDFSIAAPSKFFAYIMAKEGNTGRWVLMNEGFDMSVKPDPSNRDIIEVTNRNKFSAGRYAIRAPGGLFSFGVGDPHAIEELLLCSRAERKV